MLKLPPDSALVWSSKPPKLLASSATGPKLDSADPFTVEPEKLTVPNRGYAAVGDSMITSALALRARDSDLVVVLLQPRLVSERVSVYVEPLRVTVALITSPGPTGLL